MRLVYLGTPELAVRPLDALIEAGHEIALVVSQPDRRRGRGSSLMPSPVKAAAQQRGLAVSDQVDDVLDVGAELGVVVAFGRLIKPHVLAAVPMINLHFSLLPRWRGAAPVERAILAGDETTGVCVMEVVDELDAGGVYRRAEVPVGDKTLVELRDELVDVGSVLLAGALFNGLGPPQPQVGEITYAAKVDPGELRLDLALSASQLGRVIRLGGAWAEFRGKRLRVWAAEPMPQPEPQSPTQARPQDQAQDRELESGEFAEWESGPVVGTGDGVLRLAEVQPEGKARMAASDWWRGARPTADDRLQ